VSNAHFAIVSGTQPKKYPELWIGTGSGSDGLRSRFIPIGSNAKPLPTFQEPSDEVAVQKCIDRLAGLAQLPPQNVRFTQESGAAIDAWWKSVDQRKDSAVRVLDIVKQLIIVLAVVNLPDGHEGNVVKAKLELVEGAIRFGNFLMTVRDLVDPNDSWSYIQALENDIIGWFKAHASMTAPKGLNDCRRGVHPHRKPGGLGAFNQAWKNAIGAGVLKQRGQNQRVYLYSL
jgi:hypothetical protein